jgi:transcriptional regulator with XRE-family HTH domain
MAKLKEMLEQIRERTTPEQAQFVNDNMAIVDYIYDLLADKNMNSSDLAKALGKAPAEISKWLSGTHNMTLQSLTKISVALGETIIMTPAQAKAKYEKIKYVPLAVPAMVNNQNGFMNAHYEHEEMFDESCGSSFKIYATQYETRPKQYIH